MFDKILNKIILFPFSLLYGLAITLRNVFYDTGILKASQFNLPVVSVGNLTVGGAGKTPHIEYLVRLLKDYIYVTTLSRGYKRSTKGFRFVHSNDNAQTVGDEPLQFKRKFPDIVVAVGESRSFGIPLIVQKYPQAQIVLLDDAFQHRAVKPGLNILLTEYKKPYTRDFLLPAGRLREYASAAERADIIIVSKCPDKLDQETKEKYRKELAPRQHQKLFFSYYNYLHPYYIFDQDIRRPLDKSVKVIVLAAIANVEYLMGYLNDNTEVVQVIRYEDHHYFNAQEISRMALTLEEYQDEEIIILTTEKDAKRLELHREYILKQGLPIFVLPIEVAFHFDESPLFDKYIKDYLLNFRV